MVPALIYLDNNASTAPDPAVVDAVLSCLRDDYGNASSHHAFGFRALDRIQAARNQLATFLDCRPQDITFTSGATEANNLAIRGLWEASRDTCRDTIVVGTTEHRAVLDAAAALERAGARLLLAPVDACGVIDLAALESLVDDRTLLVSVMAANNETGTLAPLAQAVDIAHRRGAVMHSDVTQFVGRLPFSFGDLDLDLAVLSAHKMHGPKGVGALLRQRHVPLMPQLHGGGHERGLRSGTLNTPAIAGFGVAAALAAERLDEAPTITHLRDRLHDRLTARLDRVQLNGHPTHRLPNTLNLCFEGAEAEAIMASMPEVACSTGSACSAAVPEPSHVLLAMGLGVDAASECLRFSLSSATTQAEIDAASEIIAGAVRYVRAACAPIEGTHASA